MREAERQTRSYLMDLLAQGGFHPRADMGQNFLIDLNLVDFVVESAQLSPEEDVVLEIGAGTGGLTTYLGLNSRAVVSVELDTNIYRLAQTATANFENVRLLNIDALAKKSAFHPVVLQNLNELLGEDPNRRLKLVANLPYNIATPVISNLVASNLPWKVMIVTIQWELAQRMRAKPGTSDYSALSVWLQSQCRIKILKKLPPTVFWPRPRVDSAIVRLLPDPRNRKLIRNRAFLHQFVRTIFLHRRKHLRGLLRRIYRDQLEKSVVDQLLQELAIPETARAEEIEVRKLVRLSNLFRSALATGMEEPDGQPEE